MLGAVKVSVTAKLGICSGRIEHKTSTGVEPHCGKRGGEGESTGGKKQNQKKIMKIYFQTKSSRRNVLSVYRDGREPMQY